MTKTIVAKLPATVNTILTRTIVVTNYAGHHFLYSRLSSTRSSLSRSLPPFSSCSYCSSSSSSTSKNDPAAHSLKCVDVRNRPFRSVLYVPASNERALEKLKSISSRDSPAGSKPDAVMFDLEDGVGPAHKNEARESVVRYLQDPGKDANYFKIVRINRMDTPWFEDDVTAVAPLLLPSNNEANEIIDGVTLPKVQSVEDIHFASRHFSHCFSPSSSPSSSARVPFWIMIETPLSVLNASSIASHPSVQGLILGGNDLTKELNCASPVGVVPTSGKSEALLDHPQNNHHTHNHNNNIDNNSVPRLPLFTSIQMTILASRAHDKICIDAVYNSIQTNSHHTNNMDAVESGLLAECQQGKQFGMDGKTLIHPNQISTANRIFSPSDEEIKYAQRVIECWNNSHANYHDNDDCDEMNRKKRTGVTVLDGVMIEQLHVDSAYRLLQQAKYI